jgi:biopolymer transport protein ExbB
MNGFADALTMLIDRGGSVMYPLLALSVLSLALCIERAWFWSRMHRGVKIRRFTRLSDALRSGDVKRARAEAAHDDSPYSVVAFRLLEVGVNDAVAIEAVEQQRPRMERFMVVLSTIITAAPLLGILGTVFGIIQSFGLLAEQVRLTDPAVVAEGIAEALITTAFGLVITLMTLFPYMIFRGQVDRAIGRLESLIAAAQQGMAGATASADEPGTDGSPRASSSSTRPRAKASAV